MIKWSSLLDNLTNFCFGALKGPNDTMQTFIKNVGNFLLNIFLHKSIIDVRLAAKYGGVSRQAITTQNIFDIRQLLELELLVKNENIRH